MPTAHELLKLIGSPVRLKMIELLNERPRCVSELSDALRITPQAILKHLGFLERKGVLASKPVDPEGHGLVKRLYKLNVPISVSVERRDGMTDIQVRVAERRALISKAWGWWGAEKVRLLDLMQELEDEKYLLKRRLRSIRDRANRIFRQLAEVERTEEQLMEEAGCTAFEEVVLRAFLRPNPKEEISNAVRCLKVNERWAEGVVQKLTSKGLSTAG